ncbi:Ribose 1,5-bisphosphate phosphokinase PhnN [compost metagenome]
MGYLLYLMGASGVGKDSLLRALREREPGWPVAHRYITRSSDPSENCVSLSAAEFAWRREAGLFSLHWQAHGLDYGIGREVEGWLGRSELVICNGSRQHLPQARRHFGARLLPLLVEVDAATLRQRLLQRGRESAEQIETRLARLAGEPLDAGLLRHDNSGALGESAERLHRRLRGWLAEARAEREETA